MASFEDNRARVVEMAYPRWDEARARAVRFGAAQAFRQRKKRARWLLAGATLAPAVLAAAVLWVPAFERHSQQEAIAELPSKLIVLAEGVRAELLDDRADVTIQRVGAAVRVPAGRVRFWVEPQTAQAFRVSSQNVQIEVLAARFVVEALPEGVFVAVEAGKADVAWATGAVTLVAGTTGVFPPAAPAPASVDPRAGATAPASTSSAPSPRPRKEPGNWRGLARKGRYDAAYDEITHLGAGAVKDEPADLLLAADVARLSGHPVPAAASLSRLLEKYPNDPRAPSAAFTLGKLFVESLDAAEKGAARFEQARRLAPRGPLVQAALAREAEAWSRAGDTARVHAIVREYESRYPRGPHLEGLRRLLAPTR